MCLAEVMHLCSHAQLVMLWPYTIAQLQQAKITSLRVDLKLGYRLWSVVDTTSKKGWSESSFDRHPALTKENPYDINSEVTLGHPLRGGSEEPQETAFTIFRY